LAGNTLAFNVEQTRARRKGDPDSDLVLDSHKFAAIGFKTLSPDFGVGSSIHEAGCDPDMVFLPLYAAGHEIPDLQVGADFARRKILSSQARRGCSSCPAMASIKRKAVSGSVCRNKSSRLASTRTQVTSVRAITSAVRGAWVR